MEPKPKPQFSKAERRRAFWKLALTGPSGSGKTHSALLLAAGIGERIAVIDTENSSASLEVGKAGMPAFDILEIDPPYTLLKHVEAIEAALAGGYDVLVIDSISHIWDGEGGLRQQKDALDAANPSSNQFTNWRPITRDHEAFRAWLLKTDIHLICTMRSKQAYELVDDGNGKKKPVKMGMAPIQREGMEYEFAVVLDLNMKHYAEVSKDRTSLFDGRIFQPSVETGRALMAWREGATAPARIGAAPLPAATIAERAASPQAAPAAAPTRPLPNKFAGDCQVCGIRVEPNGGYRVQGPDGKWLVRHHERDCKNVPAGAAA